MLKLVLWCYIITFMSCVISRSKFKSRQVRQSVLTLLLFCASFFAHSEHYAQVEFELFSTFEQHDCHLCQHGIDSSPSAIPLYPVSIGIINIDESRITNLVHILSAYVSPQLRAPPKAL